MPPLVMTEDDGKAFPIVILDDADQAGALGYHTVDPLGRAWGRAFMGPIMVNGGTLKDGAASLSVTLSHEALEVAADPYACFWSDATESRQVALEVCDPVEGDAYEIDGVSVSNFVTPRWFRGGPGPYDWMQKLEGPFAMTPGGYMIQRSSGDTGYIWGEQFPGWKRAMKSHAAARSTKRGATP